MASKETTFCSTYHRQAFSLPSDSIIYYITKHPSTPNVYQKLTQSCKHFFIQNPVLVVPKLTFYWRKGWHTRPKERSIYLNDVTRKIWISETFVSLACYREYDTVSSFIPKIYHSSAKNVNIFDQNISLNDLMVIASKCVKIGLKKVAVMNDDGFVPETDKPMSKFSNATPVPLENIFEVLTNVKVFELTLPSDIASKTITSETDYELIKIPRFVNLSEFILHDIPETFNLERFYNFYIMKNKKMKIHFNFQHEISREYKDWLQTIINKILEAENNDFKKPYIYFYKMEKSSDDKMSQIKMSFHHDKL